MPRKPKQQTATQPNKARKRTPKQKPASTNDIISEPKPRTPKLKTQNSKLKTPDITPEQTALIEEFRSRYPFPLDPFQEEAIARLAMDESVMVAAPTGTGKTVVAEFGVFRAAHKGVKVMYTTPIKALSNQKFRDLREQYGDAVGLLTGDIIENPNGSIIVMTTEVLRNMLLQTPSALWDVGCIIFDEIHYLADQERGTTWEESIIMCPKYVQLVCLSATVNNAPEIAEWISHTHAPVHLITHLQRSVPLSLYYFLDGQLQLVINAKGQQVADFNVGGETKRRAYGGRWRGPSLEEDRPNPRERPEPSPREVVESLERSDLLPAIYFMFSRRDCEAAAEVCAMMRLRAVRDPETMRRINDILASYLERLTPEDRKLEQVQMVAYLARRGFGYHHAGLLPILKQLVEELFTKTLMRVVFATDTLALGINMPARTVVIGRMSKYDGVSRRPLIPNEFQQMAGRAGRRGIDPQGHVVVPYSPWVTFHEALNIATGPLRPVESAFTMRYNSVINLWGRGPKIRDQGSGIGDREVEADEEPLETRNTQYAIGDRGGEHVLHVMRSSLLQFQQGRRLRDLEQELEDAEDEFATIPVDCLIGYDNGEELLDEYEKLGRVLEEARRREKKAEKNLQYTESRRDELPWKRPERDELRRAFRTLPQGALLHLAGVGDQGSGVGDQGSGASGEGEGWGVYLGRGLGAVAGLFLMVAEPQDADSQPHLGEIIPLSEYRPIDYFPLEPVIVELPFALTTLAVPPTVPLDELLTADERSALEANVAEALSNVPDLGEWIVEYRAAQEGHIEAATASARSTLGQIQEEIRGTAEAEHTHVCHACPVRKEHRTYRHQRARMMVDRDAIEKSLRERRHFEETRLKNTLKGLSNALVQFNYLRKGELTYKASKLADIFDTNALMICEVVEGNYLEGLKPEDIAEVFSWFAYDREMDFLNQLLLPRYLVNLRRELDDLQNAIFAAERRQDLSITTGYNQYFYGAARSWCKGTSIGDLLMKMEMSEGDLVMTFNKTLDIMRQVREMLRRHDPDNPLRLQFEQADRMMRRGVVEMVNTLGFAPAE